MDPNITDAKKGKRQLIVIAGGCVIVVIVAVAIVWWFGSRVQTGAPALSPGAPSGNNVPVGGMTNVSFGTSTYQVALARARAWQPDAALMSMRPVDAAGQSWDVTFVSKKAKGQALVVTVSTSGGATSGQTGGGSNGSVSVSGSGSGQAGGGSSGQAVVSVNEIPMAGCSGTPPPNLITPDQAITEAHAVSGYAMATIVSLELICDVTGQHWYWGAKTSDGVTITVKATPSS